MRAAIEMWSPPQEVIDWSQVISAVLGLLALVVALFFNSKAKRDLIAERRKAHELEVLRDLGKMLVELYNESERGKDISFAVGHAVLMLRMYPYDKDDLPMLRMACLDSTAFKRKYPGVGAWPHERIKKLMDEGIAMSEVGRAIERRLG